MIEGFAVVERIPVLWGDMDAFGHVNNTRFIRWFETAHHELGHAHYYLAYSNSDVPPVLREGLNRAFHEAIGHLIGMAHRFVL